MKLIELEAPTETIKKAIADGIETVAEYNIWLQGYMIGHRDAGEVALKAIGGDDLEWLVNPDWKPESVTHHTNVED